MASLHEHDEDDVEKRLIDVADLQDTGRRQLVSAYRLGALAAAVALGSAAVLASRIGQPITATSAHQFEEKNTENGLEKHAHNPFFHHNSWAAEMKAMEEAARAAGNQTWNQTWNQTHHSPCPWAHSAHGARNHARHGPCPWASEMGGLQRSANGGIHPPQPNPIAAMLGAAEGTEHSVDMHPNMPSNFHPFSAMGAMMGNHAHQTPEARVEAVEHAANKTYQKAMAALVEDMENSAKIPDNFHPFGAIGAKTGNHTHQIPLAARLAAMEHAANATNKTFQSAPAAVKEIAKATVKVDGKEFTAQDIESGRVTIEPGTFNIGVAKGRKAQVLAELKQEGWEPTSRYSDLMPLFTGKLNQDMILKMLALPDITFIEADGVVTIAEHK